MASSGVSFGFSKKLSATKLVDSKLREDSTKDVVEKTDFVLNVSDKGIESTIKKEEVKDLVIPLITKNNWRFPSAKVGSNVTKIVTDEIVTETLDAQAAKEITTEVSKSLENPDSAETQTLNMTIPLFMQNQVPEGFETDEKMDVVLRPEQATLEDYEKVPIEAYGLAMLRGMGWKADEGIGTTNKRVVKPIEAVLRPKGLGLGADRRAAKKTSADPQDKEEILNMAVGVFVFIETGPHRTLYGQVEGLDMENGRVMVKLAISAKMVTVSEHIVRIVSDKEYKKEGKLLNKEKYEVYKAKSEKDLEKQRESLRQKSEQEDRTSHKKHKSSDAMYHESNGRESSSHSYKRKEGSWVHPLLRVRFIDKSYKNGQYYNSKVVIEDVVSRGRCVCRTDDGRLLEDIRESWLETLIPRSEPKIVMVLRGEHKGQLAEIIGKDKGKGTVHVQMARDRETILSLDFDSVCEYAATSSDDAAI